MGKKNVYLDEVQIERLKSTPDEKFWSTVAEMIDTKEEWIVKYDNQKSYVGLGKEDLLAVFNMPRVYTVYTLESNGKRMDNIIEQFNKIGLSQSSSYLLNIFYCDGDKEITMDEVAELTDYLTDHSPKGSEMIWGCTIDKTLGDHLKVLLIV